LLLEINKKNKARIGLVKNKYYSIHGSIPKNSYKVKKIKSGNKDRFII
jgi:hypothetical protein